MTDVTTNYDSWTDWKDTLAVRGETVDATRELEVLREFIYAAAVSYSQRGDITPAWANKKLPGLGIDKIVPGASYYKLVVQLNGEAEYSFRANNRAEALRQTEDAITTADRALITKISAVSAPVFTEGPEDPTPGVLPDDAPTTVDATLAKLRETIMLATVAGPKICRTGADDFLELFGLEPVPAPKTFIVKRPAEAVLETTVEAFDEETAERVATWRWENNKTGFTVAETAEPGDFEVSSN